MSDVPDAIPLADAARTPSRADAPAGAADAVEDGHVTPVMAQFIEIKAVNPDSLLFYRMGDFYELFFRDAEIASRALGIVLTKRGKHRGEDIPMCGVPIHRADEYLQRLIALGHRVAVCEQLEDPAEARKRGAKAVVRRDVVRLVTPGTLTEDTLLDAARANWLVGIARTRGATDMDDQFGLAAIDLSTGAFRVSAADRLTLAAELTRLDPAEIVIADRLGDDETLKPLWRALKAAQTIVPVAFFDAATAADRLAQHFAVASVDAFGAFSRAELAAAAGALAYVEKTQVSSRPALDVPRRDAQARAMLIDAATRANLELTRSLGGERRGTLLATIDRTLTGAGARLLAERIASPLMEPALIGARLDAVAWCVDDPALRARLRAALAAAADMARPLARLALGRGGPRDLDAIRAGLQAARQLADLIEHPALPAELAEARAALHAAPVELAAHLQAALADELPVLRRDGGFVRAFYSRDLDETRLLQSDSRRLIAGLEADYALETGIRSLKIRHNNVLGYHVDLAATHAERLLSPPLNARFIHRQTLANAVRFSTPELSDLEARIASAAERALGQEQAIFDELLGAVMAARDPIKRAADALAIIDVTAALADLADTEGWVRPIVDDSLTFAITGGRHPVVEAALKVESGAGFVANDCHLTPRVPAGDGRITIVTGPNMGGKSTYLRQNALITVLAQSGSFVPARAAHIGIVDRLFSRVGASDDLARGRSTFMVEMVETAAILNQAGRRALVILDEIGRGTSTFDGLSIAWGTIEHLHEVNRARALFATHYHELTALARRLDRVVNATIKVREWKGDVVFLHEIVPGVADRSYGIQVARLAGLPSAVITRAKAVLKQLEDQDVRRPATQMIDDLPLFAALVKPPEPAAPVLPPSAASVLAALADVQPDDLSPREAQAALYRLKALLAGSGST